jgi:hypothetical protein
MSGKNKKVATQFVANAKLHNCRYHKNEFSEVNTYKLVLTYCIKYIGHEQMNNLLFCSELFLVSEC